MLLSLGRHHWFGADKLDHPLRHPPQVEVKTYRGVSRDYLSRQPLRRMEQRRRGSTNRPSMREGRVLSGPWYEERGSLPKVVASMRSASASRRVRRDARTDGGARTGYF